jgi:DNA polymerase-3 subunit delta
LPAITPAQLRKQLETGETDPLYMLLGGDDAEKASVAAEFAEMLDEGLRAFNFERLYGGDMKVDDLIQAAAMLPMMAPRRVVVILEAEKLLVPKRESKAADEELERLEQFVKAPPDHATVVFVCGAADGRRRVVKLLRDQASLVDCGTIENAEDAEVWVKARAAREGANLDPGAVRALVERGGNDVVRLRSGLERVMLYAMGQPAITADDVKQVVPAAPDAHDDFGIANAIRDGDAAGALRQLTGALEAGGVPFVLMGQLRWVAERAPSARVREAIEAVFRTDLALKSSGGDPRILLERLVVELSDLVGAGFRRPGGRGFTPRHAAPGKGPSTGRPPTRR